ncbi:hypothetical protein QYM36_009265 [Artemia franciscana]|uniref:Uncharacterized protein n=1 Tax=Artemia franciscana TaxID=6661 RepID=A0AA88L579_ARTSF|nr:hypothetical protein QYM36_009265 [Artemia franciscana]
MNCFLRYKLDPRESKRSFGKLLSAAEQSKHILSTMNSSHVFVESLCEGVDFSTNVSRARFEMLVQTHISRLCSPIQECIEKGGFTAGAIDKLIIVGGSLRMPGFQQAVKDRLPNAELLSSVSPDEVIAVGAAQQAAIMADIGLTDVLNSAVPVSCLPEKISLKVDLTDVTVFEPYAPVPSFSQINVPYRGNGLPKPAQICKNNEVIFEKTLSDVQDNTDISARFLLQRDGHLAISLSSESKGELVREIVPFVR